MLRGRAFTPSATITRGDCIQCVASPAGNEVRRDSLPALRKKIMNSPRQSVVITGASSGIGRATALAMARRGANVVLGARTAAALEEVANSCRALGVRAIAQVTDVTKADDCRRLIETAERELGGLDVLVNNAGFAIFDPIEQARLEDLESMMQTNYF